MNSTDVKGPVPRAPRILVRGTNWLGDAVMTTPALMRLREYFPDAHITLLTPEKLRDLWNHHPAMDEIISFSTDEYIWEVASRLKKSIKQVMKLNDQRRKQDFKALGESAKRSLASPFHNLFFDLALVLPNSPRSVIETWLAGIPRRVGYARPWRNFFLTEVVPSGAGTVKMRKRSPAEIRRLVAADVNQRVASNGRAFTSTATKSHQIHEYLHLVAALGASPAPTAPQLFITSNEIEATKKKFGLEKVTQPIFGLNPGAEYGPAKRWPVECFITAAKEIQQRTNCLWILLGGKGDAPIVNQIESGIQNSKFKTQNLVDQTSLRELMSLLSLCRVLLTNDSGPMHVAAALGTPVVVPFGSTSPELTGPGLPGDNRHRFLKSDVPCSPCFLRECPIDFRCMNSISVGRVVEAVVSCNSGL